MAKTEPKSKKAKKKATKVPSEPVIDTVEPVEKITPNEEFSEFVMSPPVLSGVSYGASVPPSLISWTNPTITTSLKPTTGKVVFYKDDAGQHRWRLKATNGRVLCSPEGFSSKTKAKNNLRAVGSALRNPVIEDDPESYPS